MFEVPHSGQDHGDFMFIGHLDYRFIGNRAAWLDNSFNFIFCG
jgi:hypothetical protein